MLYSLNSVAVHQYHHRIVPLKLIQCERENIYTLFLLVGGSNEMKREGRLCKKILLINKSVFETNLEFLISFHSNHEQYEEYERLICVSFLSFNTGCKLLISCHPERGLITDYISTSPPFGADEV